MKPQSPTPQSPVDFDDGKRFSYGSNKMDGSVNNYSGDDEELQSMTLWDIVKLNHAEWWHILLGCIASFVMGASMPLFAVLFGEIIGVIKYRQTVDT